MRILIKNEELKEKLYPNGYWLDNNLLFVGGVCLKKENNQKRLFIIQEAISGGFNNGASFVTIFKNEAGYATGSTSLEKASEKYYVLDDNENDICTRFIYIVTEENTYAIKEDIKNAGGKWDKENKFWYFTNEPDGFKVKKTYLI